MPLRAAPASPLGSGPSRTDGWGPHGHQALICGAPCLVLKYRYYIIISLVLKCSYIHYLAGRLPLGTAHTIKTNVSRHREWTGKPTSILLRAAVAVE